MASTSSIRRKIAQGSLALACLTAFAACATTQQPRSRINYRLVWVATRSTDHSTLATVSATIAPGRSVSVRTDSTVAVEDKPAFPAFTAELSRTKKPGVYELVTRASLRELRRNSKGKIRKRKRNIGGLVPIRVGESQVISEASDAVHLEVRLEPE